MLQPIHERTYYCWYERLSTPAQLALSRGSYLHFRYARQSKQEHGTIRRPVLVDTRGGNHHTPAQKKSVFTTYNYGPKEYFSCARVHVRAYACVRVCVFETGVLWNEEKPN